MKTTLQSPALALRLLTPPRTAFPRHHLHVSQKSPATSLPITAHGPPPSAPVPSVEHAESRVARKRKQAELLKKGQDLQSGLSGSKAGTGGRTKRFWKDVHVRKVDDGYQILLDTRPIRTPTKAILTIPHHKPHLATAIALEWDLLVSAQQALKQHLIPLTSLVSRSLDIANEDYKTTSYGSGPIRASIVQSAMRYLDTDTLLCWAPTALAEPPGYEDHVSRKEKGLRQIQQETAQPIIQYLTQRVWPGIEIIPVLDDSSIMPKRQPPGTREVIQGWITGLSAWELAGLERGVLAGKSLIAAVRLLVEWSSEMRNLREGFRDEQRFGIEEAARAAMLEVDWQTGMWGEVEDTHDVDKEDVRRQFGSVVLLVSGEEV